MNFTYEKARIDALIIGSGLSALMAARSLHMPEGMQAMIIGTGSGASPFVHGFNMPLHPDDSVDCFIEDTLRSGRGQNSKSLVEELCRGSLELLPVLRGELGVDFDKKDGQYKFLRPLGASHPRVVSVGNETGVEIIKKIREELLRRPDITFCPGYRALRLMVRDGCVCGALVYSAKNFTYTFIETKTVILASGGFCGIYPFSTNTSDIGGDGIAMAYEAGLPLVDLEFVQFEPSAAVYPDALRGRSVITTMYYEGAVLRNKNGDRFMLSVSDKGECVDKDVQARAIFTEIAEGRGTEHGGVYFDATGVGAEKLNEQYSSYVKRYSDVGIDISKEPFEIAPAPHTSLGGVMIAPDCSTAVRGVFACGEITGGLHGANRIGGNAGLETLVFGRRAGLSAAVYLAGAQFRKTDAAEIDTFVKSVSGWGVEYTPEKLADIKAQVSEVLSKDLNVLRCGIDLGKAVWNLRAALKSMSSATCRSNNQLYDKLRIQNDLTAAYLLAVAANARGESCGCHVRTDSSPEGRGVYSVVISHGKDGSMSVKKRPVAE